MKDSRALLENVRRIMPPNAKLLVVWCEGKGPLHCSQSNMDLKDISELADSLKANCIQTEQRVG